MRCLETILLIDRNETQLGISGGEPTLLGDDLLVVLHHARRHLSHTGLHVLSNGRRFSDVAFARSTAAIRHPNLTWGIPVYSDSPEIHDYIVQARGAWSETLAGLFNLARVGADIEIRVVIQRANVERLPELAYFIFRNLTFAQHVAFMSLEPIGLAPGNRDALWVDPADSVDALRDATFFLANRGMNVSLYNYPLCTLPKELWSFAQQSISDWKNTYLPVCGPCGVKQDCCGVLQVNRSAVDQPRDPPGGPVRLSDGDWVTWRYPCVLGQVGNIASAGVGLRSHRCDRLYCRWCTWRFSTGMTATN